MKKIFGLTIAALMVMGLIGGGTWAYFSDTETISGNTLTAGTLDLELGATASLPFGLSDVKPGDSGSGDVTLTPAGSLGGELDIAISSITNTAGAGGTEYEGGSGELGGAATMALWIDVNQNGSWDSGDIELENDGSAVGYDSDATLDGGTIDSFGGDSWDDIFGGLFSSAADFYVDWDIDGASVGNEIQGDSAAFDISFVFEQVEAD